MKKLTAISLAVVLVTLIVPGLVHAQDTITIGGVLQAADCRANTLTLKTGAGSPRVFATASTTGVYVNSAPAALCTLAQYTGRDAVVWLTASGDHLLAGRVDISVAVAAVPAQSADYGSPYGSYNYGPSGYGPYFDPYYNPYLNFDPYYYGTYLYPFDIGIDIDGHFRDRGFDRGGFDRGGRDFRGGGATHGGFSGARVTGGFRGQGGAHGGGRR
jgi:hypothetical protein